MNRKCTDIDQGYLESTECMYSLMIFMHNDAGTNLFNFIVGMHGKSSAVHSEFHCEQYLCNIVTIPDKENYTRNALSKFKLPIQSIIR